LEDLGIFGESGYFLSGHAYDVGVMVIFLFQMVFMDTALTIVTGACAERWKFITFSVTSVIMGALTYPLFANWAWAEDGWRNWEPTWGWEKGTPTSPVRASCTQSADSLPWPCA